MKAILSLILYINISFAYTWICKGEASAPSIYEYSQLNGYPAGAYGFENMPDELPNLYGEVDTVNDTLLYWDDTSPVCGGNGSDNRLIEAYCNASGNNSGCWDVTTGGGSTNIITSGNGGYTNNVILVDSKPCLPRGISNFGFGAYEWDNNTDIGMASANLNTIFDESIESVSSEVAQTQREICGTDSTESPSSTIDYTAQLDQIIDNTAPNSQVVSKLTNIDNREQQKDDDLNTFISGKDLDSMMSITNDLDTFNTTFETTLSDTYTSYSDVFGFGDYGVAPEPISFNMFGTEYKVFDPTVLNPHIDLIRNTFAIFAYLWGFIIVFRGI